MDIVSADKPGDTSKTTARRTGGPLFTHQPLDLDTASVRLVEVLPLGPDGEVKCKIRPAMLHTSIFTCVSYVWGPHNETHWITIDDKPFEVRKNLWSFLNVVSTLRSKTLEGTDLLDVHELDTERCFQSLWIDALCIDQENVLERNHQVQQMGQIYSNAEHVISWIGTDLDIVSLFQFAWRHTRYRWWSKKQQISEHMDSIKKLHKNVYWTRAWITQELILARAVHVLANDVAIPLTVLHDVGETLKVVHERDFQWDLWQPMVHVQHGSTRPTLIENLWRFRGKRCSDLRDAAYSLLSISSDGDKLRVDYTCSLAELARNVMRLYEQTICLHTTAIIIQVLRLDQVNLKINIDLPFIEMSSSVTPPSFDHCRNCGLNLRIYSLSQSIFCLRCTRPRFIPLIQGKNENTAAKHPGHLVLIWGITAHNQQHDWRLFWAPHGDAQWQVLERHKDVVEVENDQRTLYLSVGLVCELMSLLSLSDTLDDETVRRIARARPQNRVQGWKVATKDT